MKFGIVPHNPGRSLKIRAIPQNPGQFLTIRNNPPKSGTLPHNPGHLITLIYILISTIIFFVPIVYGSRNWYSVLCKFSFIRNEYGLNVKFIAKKKTLNICYQLRNWSIVVRKFYFTLLFKP